MAYSSYTRAARALAVLCAAAIAWPVAVNCGVSDIRQVTPKDDYKAASFSPDGALLAATQGNYAGIWLVAEDGPPQVLCAREMAGFGCLWLPDSSGLVYRSRSGLVSSGETVSLRDRVIRKHSSVLVSSLPMQWQDTVFLLSPDCKPQIVYGAAAPEALNFAVAEKDVIYLHEGPKRMAISPPDDRFFLPQLSPDGKYVAFAGMQTGLWVYSRTAGRAVNLGPGSDAAWAPDSSYLYFDVETDDGARILSADLWRATPDGAVREQLTATPDRIEMRPALSPDGKRIAFDADGAIWTGIVEGN